jgi:hypothetical protein
MQLAPEKYGTKYTLKKINTVISEVIYEAINKTEAQARACL